VLLDNAAKYVESAQGEIGVAESPPSLAPPALPRRPTDQDAKTFFGKIKGQWHLNYGRGHEDVDIDAEGNYRLIKKASGEGAAAEHLQLCFRLLLLACDAEFKNVELAKQQLNGRVLQIEVLRVEPKTLVGYAKHDEHPLRYERTK
jgi:hypothetical protein